MADVYVLASPAPTLYVYPSQVHPVRGGVVGRPFTPVRQPERLRGRGSLRVRVTVLGRARLSVEGVTQHVAVLASGRGRSRGAGRAEQHVTRGIETRGIRAQGRSVTGVAGLARCTDHAHLSLPLPLLDLLTESWDS